MILLIIIIIKILTPKKKINEIIEEIKKILFGNSGIYQNIMNYKYKKELKDFLNLFEVLKYYIFTYDNFRKFIFIAIRLRVNLPVILMGETGVGKTALLKVLINSLPYKTKLIILTIHNGIDNKKLEDFVNQNKLFENDEEKENNQDKEIIYILFDEINSCHSMGLLSEMMIKHSFFGKKLKKNIKFLGTCNPVRKIRSISDEHLTYGLINDKSKFKDKEYKVNDLPDCLLNFVFDFGSLKVDDEKKYIEQISNKILSKLNCIPESGLRGLKELIKDSIEFSQTFFRNTFDRTTVSLRDLRRYSIFFEFYYKLIKNEKLKFKNIEIQDKDERVAILLTLYICYYIRIRDEKYKKKYIKEIKTNFFAWCDIDIENLYTEILNNFCLNLDKSKYEGIALNRIMKQNLFCLFSCILNKVPIIICGNPGCSKSSSFNIIESHMKNETNEYFKDFPVINKISYQGSETSTSEGILRIYDKVIKSIENDEKMKKNDNFIHINKTREKLFLFYFDEMGLAEISEKEPLKVIHSILEFDKDYDENKTKFPFVGISNWVLDSSKMNRAIYLNVPPLNEDDLNETYEEIIKFYGQEKILEKNNDIFKILSKTYLNITKEEKYNKFFGLRDFYNLIKTISLKSKSNKNYEKTIWEIVLESIERNFGGIKDSVVKFKEILFNYCIKGNIEVNKEIIQKEYLDIKGCVFENIDSEYSRNILIIYEDSSLCNYIIKFILEKKQKQYDFYLGSPFIKDINDETQISSTIKEIGINLNEGKVIIFQNLDSVYPSLYELFNQSYEKLNGKLYTKISLGYSSDVRFPVNEKYRSIILVNSTKIKDISFPLLNRFEKQIVSLNNLLMKEEIELGKKIYDNLIYFITHIKNEKPFISLKNEIINLNQEEINGLIYQLKHKGKSLTYENSRNYIYNKFANILTQDIIAFSNYSKLKEKDRFEYDILIKNYIEQHKNIKNLESLLGTMNINDNDAANMSEKEKENSYYIHKIL